MEGAITVYNGFKLYQFNGGINLGSGGATIMLSLHYGYTPDIALDAVWADVEDTEYESGDGYTAGGEELGSKLTSLDNDNNRALWDAADVTWAALGPLSPEEKPSHAILRASSVSGQPLIGYVELGERATNGGSFTVQWSNDPQAILTQG